MTPKERFKALDETCFQWWANLTDPDANGVMSDGADRAAMARLRRFGSAAEADMETALSAALAEPAFFGGFRRQGRQRPGLLNRVMQVQEAVGDKAALALAPQVLVAAIVLADIRKSQKGSTAKYLRNAQVSEGELPPSARARFLRLLRTDDVAVLLPQARRLTRFLKREAPAGELGASLILWTDPANGPALRSRWAFDFFSTIPSAEATPNSEPTP